MNFLEQKIMEEGTIKPGNILKVDNFLNHQIDIDIMRQIAYEFKRRFRGEPVTKILTIEASGIAIGVLLGDLYGKPAVVCDTHCIRIANRLGLARGKEPEKVERQLRAILPPEESSDFCHRIVLFGREVCTARSPHCDRCELRPYCREFSGE